MKGTRCPNKGKAAQEGQVSGKDDVDRHQRVRVVLDGHQSQWETSPMMDGLIAP
jgi:hypothetical protein